MQIQPSEFIMLNNFDWFQGNAIKYLCRHKLKGNALDVKKAIHYAQMLLEAHYGIESTIKYSDETEEGPKKRKVKRVKKDKNELPVAQPAVAVST